MKKYSALIIITTSLFACTNNSNGFEKNQDKIYEPASIEASTPIDTRDTITVIASGANMSEMQFDTKLIKVPAQKQITIKLVNESTDATMPHNFVVIKNGTANDVGQAGYKHLDNAYVSPQDENVFGHTPLAQINETVYLTFTTPNAGEHQFICSYPGHWGMMKGSFITE